MAAAGIYTLGGAFWEFGQPDWAHTKLFMLFGVAEDHDSNPIKMGIGRIKARGARVIRVNPIRTGYNAVVDDWVGITPGTDGLFILALVHVLLKAGRIDLDYLARYTNAPCLVIDAPGTEDHGLLLRDAEGRLLVRDRASGALVPFDRPGVRPDLAASHEVNGRTCRTVMHKIAETYLSDAHAPEAVAERCGIPASRIRVIAGELARVAFEEEITLNRPWTDFRGERHETMTGRPVSFHAMRGISAHANGFQTARALHLLQILLGTVEVPGGFRFKPPYPKPVEAHPTPHHKASPDSPLDGPHLGFPRGPEDLAIAADGRPDRIDKAFSWENPLSAHGLMHMVISNAHAGDPYRIDTLFLYMANMAWNSTMNTSGVTRMLTDTDETGDYVILRIIYSDAYSSEMVAYADLVLPDTTYLERHDCISLLDRPICEPDAAADAIRWPVVDPDRPGHAGVQGFQTTLVQLANRLKLPGFTDAKGDPVYTDYADYMVNHERKPGIGPLAGWRGEDGRAEGRGAHQPPDHLRPRLRAAMTPLPLWQDADQTGNDGFPIHALTQRPMAMYHSWGSQNAWLRQIHGHNPLYVPPKLMRAHGLHDGDWARVSSPHGEIVVPVVEMAALNENTVWTWNAIGKRKGAWALDEDAPEATRGFLLNHLIHELLPEKGDGLRWANSDPVTGQAAWFDLKVKIEKVPPPGESRPGFAPIAPPVGKGPDRLAWKVGE